MSSRPKPKKRLSTTDGQVYILKIWIGDHIYFKVGTTNRATLSRLKEIGTELLGILGYWPKMKIVTERFTKNNYQVEAEVLRVTLKYQPKLVLPEFSGCTELRCMDEVELLSRYNEAMVKDYPAAQRELIEL